jgi:hypothetical protein
MQKDRKINRIKQVEMSPGAIDRRLLDLAQLYKLGIAIQSARRLGKVNEIRSLEGLENQNKCGRANTEGTEGI